MRPALGAVLLAVGIAAIAMLGIVGAGWSPNVAYIVAVAVVAAFGGAALRRLLERVAGPAWPSAVARSREAAGVDPRIGTIETALRRGTDDVGICRRRVQPLLFDLATHRLRRRRGISLVEEPEAAQRLLGDEPFHFLTDVVEEPASVSTLARTVDAIERL
jgi:hypothetical protein